VRPTTPKAPGAGWYGITEKLGCGGADAGQKTIECMRQKKFEDITKAMANGNSFMTPFTPSADEKVIFKDMTARKKAGDFIKKVRAISELEIMPN
jgi:cholinesterase